MSEHDEQDEAHEEAHEERPPHEHRHPQDRAQLTDDSRSVAAVHDAAARIGADADALLDSAAFYGRVTSMDPDSPGYRNLVTHIFAKGGRYLDSDVVFGVKESLIEPFVVHRDGTAPDGRSISGDWVCLERDFCLASQDG